MIQVALLVGGAGGIGRATAHLLSRAVDCLVVADRDPIGLASLVAELPVGAAQVLTYELDATDGSAVEALVDEVGSRGALSILINTVGIVQLGGVRDVTEFDWDRMLNINLKSVYLTCRAVIPRMVAAGGGAVVNVASVSGRTKSIYSAPNYVASKAGVIGLTMSLASQHARDGIRVNCVAPGIIDTPMLDAYSAEQKQSMLAAIPMARLGRAEEVGECIAFLASKRASYITGQTINVNGGQFML
jgi:NAD(P)-dependent dehydrogenase (short-subunit alcohol dehydrogenase family)